MTLDEKSDNRSPKFQLHDWQTSRRGLGYLNTIFSNFNDGISTIPYTS